MIYKRSLSESQSRACEDAIHAVCLCRCGGALHGISHKLYAEVEAQILEEKGEITDEDVEEIIEYVKERLVEETEGHNE